MLPFPLHIAASLLGNFLGSLHDPTFIMMLVLVGGMAAAAPRIIYPIGFAILCAAGRYYIAWSNMSAAGIDAPAFALYSGCSALIAFLLIIGIVRLIRRIVG